MWTWIALIVMGWIVVAVVLGLVLGRRLRESDDLVLGSPVSTTDEAAHRSYDQVGPSAARVPQTPGAVLL